MLINSIKNKTVAILYSVCLMLTFVALPSPALAACGDNTPKGQVLRSVTQTAGSSTDCKGTGATSLVGSAISDISLVIGVVAIIMVLVAGYKYIIASGDPNNIKSARETLIYALVGVAIAVLAQFLVHFVFTAASTATN